MTRAYSLMALTWIASLWQGAAMALLAAACLRMMPRAGAAMRHLLLVVVFGIAVSLPLLPLHTGSLAAEQTGIALSPWIATAIGLIWLAASAIRAAGLLHAWLHLRRVRASATPIALEDVDGFAAAGRSATLCASDDVDTPAVLGFFRPTLLLPTWLVPTLSEDELRAIALHECEHLRRRDDWTNLLLQIGLVLMPLNPALLWLNRRIATERELACDAAVVAATAKPLAYAASLTHLAERRIRHHGLRLALAALGRESELSQRVHALLRQPSPTWSKRQSAVAMCASAAVLCTLATGLVHAPRFVHVAEPAETVAALPAEQPILRTTPAAVTMLPVSYEIKPAAKRIRKPVRPISRTVSATTTLMPRTVRFLRTAARTQDLPLRDAIQYDDRSVRMVTAEFVPEYVAVPVANGWLLIEL